jgi:hypothetical protein
MRVVRVALLTQHATRMGHIVKSCVATLAPPYFPHYFINGTIFGKKCTENEVCVLIFSTNFV